jgi:hypothetical protein
MLDYRFALICTLLAEVNRDRKKRPKPFKPQDFMPQREHKVLNNDQMKKRLEMINIMLGGKIESTE